MKHKFKVGDRVKHVKHQDIRTWGVGVVTKIDFYNYHPPLLRVEWSAVGRQGLKKPGFWHDPEDLEPAETPIERMRRLYNEEENYDSGRPSKT